MWGENEFSIAGGASGGPFAYHGAALLFRALRRGGFCHLCYGTVNNKDTGLSRKEESGGPLPTADVTKLPTYEKGNKEQGITQVVLKIPSRTAVYRQRLTVGGFWQRLGASR